MINMGNKQISINLLKNSKPINIHYVDGIFDEGDTETKIYDTCKLTVLLSDNLLAVLPDKLIGGKKGDILLFNPKEIHFGRFLRQGNYRFVELYIPFSFFGDIFESTDNLERIFEDNPPERINCLSGDLNEKLEIIDVAEKIISLIKDYESCKNAEIFMNVLRIILISSKLYAKNKNAATYDITTPSYVLNAIEYISGHYHEPIKAEDISSELNCSVAYLSRLFKKYVGTGLYNYLIEYRVHMAANLLHTDCSVTDICYRVGFSDCSNFIKKFKKIMGVTPLQYKKLIKG